MLPLFILRKLDETKTNHLARACKSCTYDSKKYLSFRIFLEKDRISYLVLYLRLSSGFSRLSAVFSFYAFSLIISNFDIFTAIDI